MTHLLQLTDELCTSDRASCRHGRELLFGWIRLPSALFARGVDQTCKPERQSRVSTVGSEQKRAPIHVWERDDPAIAGTRARTAPIAANSLIAPHPGPSRRDPDADGPVRGQDFHKRGVAISPQRLTSTRGDRGLPAGGHSVSAGALVVRLQCFHGGVDFTFGLEPVLHRFPVLSASGLVNFMGSPRDSIHSEFRRSEPCCGHLDNGVATILSRVPSGIGWGSARTLPYLSRYQKLSLSSACASGCTLNEPNSQDASGRSPLRPAGAIGSPGSGRWTVERVCRTSLRAETG